MRKLIFKTYQIAHRRNWNKICWAVDIHDVILEANYKAGDIPKTFLGNAKAVLQRLSKRSDTTLILNTCSYPDEIVEYQKFFKDNDIIFKYVNENPDCPNTAFGNFEKKFYFNILLEDKAGFEPHEWDDINEAMNTIDETFILEMDGNHLLGFVYPMKGYYRELNSLGMIKAEDCKLIGPLDLTKNVGR